MGGRSLSISNIAWPHTEEGKILPCLADFGFTAIEIAPSRIWDNFEAVSSQDRKKYLNLVESYGLKICSMHSLFFTARNMALFGTKEEQKNLQSYFRLLIQLAQDMQVPRMIFGSPSVRKRGDIGIRESMHIAAESLAPVSEYAFQCGTKILIEPLSSQETDFISSHKEGKELVQCVGSRGFGLHLDAKAICSEGTPVDGIIEDCKDSIEHFHVNEKGLGSFKEAGLPHTGLAGALRKSDYKGFVSIEMKQLDNYEEEIRYALDFVRRVYGS